MALESVFRDLQSRLQELDEALGLLHRTLEDRPPRAESALVDDLENIVLDMMGELQEMRKAASIARRRVSHPLDLEGARLSLARCQERFHKMDETVSGTLMSFDKLKELARLGTRGCEWPSWSNRTRQDIDQCRQPLHQTGKALVACWQELLEHSGGTSISIRNQSLGQKIQAGGVEKAVSSST